MKIILTFIFPFLIMGSLSAQESFLNSYKGKNRLILLFAEANSSSILDAQLSEFSQDEAGIADRDLKIFIIKGNSVTDPQGQVYYEAQPEVLRRNFRINDGRFRMILLGKDGGPKMANRRFVTNSEVFGLIDSMPIRQQEMRDKGN